MTPGEATRGARLQPRIRSLDGLRGLAALIVVFHHAMLTDRSLAEPYVSPQVNPGAVGTASWWLTYTPLHLLWDGTAAVYVFFILSGYVLVLPVMRKGRSIAGWIAYYPARLLRLYLPVAASVGLVLPQRVLIPRHTVTDGSWWLNAHDEPVGARAVVRDLVLVRGVNWLNSALWSLKWEVIFSVILPLAIVGVFVGRRWWSTKLVILFALMVFGLRTGDQSLLYLPMFGVGALMAREQEALRRLALRLGTRIWILLTFASLLLLNAYWLFWGLGELQDYANIVGEPLEVLGACLAVFIVSEWRSAGSVAEKPPWQWLGQRSFSLYLVHEPIVVSVALLLGATANPVPVLFAAVPLSLGLAEVFYRIVEKPGHALARGAGRLTQRLAR